MDIDSQFKQANADLRAGRFGEAEKRYRALARARPQGAHRLLIQTVILRDLSRSGFTFG